MFIDMHLGGINETCSKTVETMVKAVQSEKPDLVLLGGDNVTSGLNNELEGKKSIVLIHIPLMTEQPWTAKSFTAIRDYILETLAGEDVVFILLDGRAAPVLWRGRSFDCSTRCSTNKKNEAIARVSEAFFVVTRTIPRGNFPL